MICPRRRTAVHYRGPGSGENRGRNRDLTLPTDYFCQPGIREGSNGGGLGSKFSPGCFSPATDYLEVGLKQSSERRKKFASGLDLLCTSQKEESPRERGWCKAAITGGSGAALLRLGQGFSHRRAAGCAGAVSPLRDTALPKGFGEEDRSTAFCSYPALEAV
ncbi:hypothetical protein I79_009776 [Cricetulus griseus]|uniref:Uncharacterized protein n=1 Tax=Cricetulus griseus TaxID=10029 RepID=G3HGN8_CRIGR|nr:hypothetical protein I79_009776 [Cricetulus griseus]